jgi:hypothetical protein
VVFEVNFFARGAPQGVRKRSLEMLAKQSYVRGAPRISDGIRVPDVKRKEISVHITYHPAS